MILQPDSYRMSGVGFQPCVFLPCKNVLNFKVMHPAIPGGQYQLGFLLAVSTSGTTKAPVGTLYNVPCSPPASAPSSRPLRIDRLFMLAYTSHSRGAAAAVARSWTCQLRSSRRGVRSNDVHLALITHAQNVNSQLPPTKGSASRLDHGSWLS